jgi:hypothetical protein
VFKFLNNIKRMPNFDVPSESPKNHDEVVPELSPREAAEGYIGVAGLVAEGKVQQSKLEGGRVREDIVKIAKQLQESGDADTLARMKEAGLIDDQTLASAE